jgi:hypothetical protein
MPASLRATQVFIYTCCGGWAVGWLMGARYVCACSRTFSTALQIMQKVTANWREAFCRIVPDYPVWTLMDPAVASRTPDELGVPHRRAWWLVTAFGGRLARSMHHAMTTYCQVCTGRRACLVGACPPMVAARPRPSFKFADCSVLTCCRCRRARPFLSCVG